MISKGVGAIEAEPASTVRKGKAEEAIIPGLSAVVRKDAVAIDAVGFFVFIYKATERGPAGETRFS